MDVSRIGDMRLTPLTDAERRRQAEEVVQKFETIFARTFVSGMRQTADITGEGGGMFGSGPGADTYADWFDDNLSSHLSRTGQLGIGKVLMRDLERWRQVPPAEDAAKPDHSPQDRPRSGGIDVAI